MSAFPLGFAPYLSNLFVSLCLTAARSWCASCQAMTHCQILALGHALLLFSASLGMFEPETGEEQISALITQSKQQNGSEFFSETSKVTLLSLVLIVFSFKYI